MMRNHKRAFLLAVLGIIAGCGIFLYGHPRKSPKNLPSRQAENNGRIRYVQRGAVLPQLRKNLDLLGNRLERPGKERILLAGVARFAGNSNDSTIEVIREFPDRVRLVEQTGVRRNVTVFNGRFENSRSLSDAERDTIETLVFDSVEFLFAAQTEGIAASFLGTRFRMDDGAAANYAGPFYDIVLLAQRPRIGRAEPQRAASYYFNSDTGFLDRVRYKQERNGSLVDVEVFLNDWREIAGERIPMSLERFENGNSVLKFTFGSAMVSSRKSDNAFSS